jgi:2'-5' RNA ligase
VKRTFIAVKVDPGQELTGIISLLKSTLSKENIKWADINNMHITLAFLGDTEENQIQTIITMLKDNCTGLGEFTFTLRGLGVFRNITDPRVIWAGIDMSEKFVALNRLIKNGLKEIEIMTEDRQFKPHLTLGRVKNIKNRNDLRVIIDNYHDREFQKVHVNEIVFYESILKQTGPIYIQIAGFNL